MPILLDLDLEAPNGRVAAMQQAALIMAVYRNAREQYGAYLSEGGVDAQVLAWQHNPVAIKPSWALARQEKTLILTIGGTVYWQQWLRHIDGTWGTKITGYEGPDGDGVWMHDGMRVPADVLWLELNQAIADVKPERILISGHSYGAGVADCLAVFIQHDEGFIGRNVQILGMGGPRVITTTYTPLYPIAHHWRLQHEKDVVTTQPQPYLNARAVVGTVAGGLLGKLGLTWLFKQLGGKAAAQTVSIPQWSHIGRRAVLFKGGHIQTTGPALIGYDSWDTSGAPGSHQWIDRPADTWSDDHVMGKAYWPSLRSWYKTEPVTPQIQKTIDFVEITLAGLPAPDRPDASWWDYVSPRAGEIWRDSLGAGAGGGWDDVARSEAVGVSYALTRTASNLPKGSGAMPSGKWKFTVFYSWGNKGKSTSIHRLGPSTLDGALAEAYEWAKLLGRMLGRDPGMLVVAKDFLGSPKTPRITHVRVSDAMTTRGSRVIRVGVLDGVGPPATAQTQNTPADFGGTAIAWSLAGLSTESHPTKGRILSRDRLTIYGQPDLCCTGQSLNKNQPIKADESPPRTIGSELLALNNMYTTGNNKASGTPNTPWGFMGRDPREPDLDIQAWVRTPAGGVQIVVEGHNYETGDWLKVKGSKTAVLDRTWRIDVGVDNTIMLRGALIHAQELPSPGGQVYRVKKADGTVLKDFYQYVQIDGGAEKFLWYDIVGRKLGRVYDPLASRPKRRKRVTL